jgi:ADP-ribosylglycohydrolase
MEKQERAESAILGLAVGDAMGVPAECMSREELARDPVTEPRGGGVHGQMAGTWSDDTSMTLCVMDSLMENGMDCGDQMRRFASWLWNAENTARDEIFDVGGATKQAIFRFVKGCPPLQCGETAENTCGNGSLMRMLPTALYLAGHEKISGLDGRAAEWIHDASKCTHAHPKCQMACGIYCSVVFHLLDGESPNRAVSNGVSSALAFYETQPEFARVQKEFASLREIGTWTERQVESTGYVLHTLQAALWCLLTTADYASCVLKAVNLGEDADTTAAVAGGLAGLVYGADAIPESWKAAAAKYEELRQRSRRFAGICFATGALNEGEREKQGEEAGTGTV